MNCHDLREMGIKTGQLTVRILSLIDDNNSRSKYFHISLSRNCVSAWEVYCVSYLLPKEGRNDRKHIGHRTTGV